MIVPTIRLFEVFKRVLLQRGEGDALQAVAPIQQGQVVELTGTLALAALDLWRGKGNCTACHVGPTFSDERTHNTCAAWRNGRLHDEGRFIVTGKTEDRGAFKTPRFATWPARRPTCTTATSRHWTRS